MNAPVVPLRPPGGGGRPPPTGSVAELERRHNEGHGRRLTAAFHALDGFPAMLESRERLLALLRPQRAPLAEVAAEFESDPGLAIALLRFANRLPGHRRCVPSVVEAVRVAPPTALHALVVRTATSDPFGLPDGWNALPERFRRHALATQRAAERVAAAIGYDEGDRLATTALLHDLGTLVLARAYARYPRGVHGDARTPAQRAERERQELGVDHGVVGGVLARRWGLPDAVASVIERHHAPDADGEAALVALADLLAHWAHGAEFDSGEVLRAAGPLGLGAGHLRAIVHDVPLAGPARGPRHCDPCPLSSRELEVLGRLAEGKVYKQIARELELSTSTIRTHLHNIYGKLGAVDRAQAVLLATQRGWL